MEARNGLTFVTVVALLLVACGDDNTADDPDSGMQQFEDDRDWHHDQRRAEGHDVCPECGTELGSSG